MWQERRQNLPCVPLVIVARRFDERDGLGQRSPATGQYAINEMLVGGRKAGCCNAGHVHRPTWMLL
ncbi:hypothetical protein ACCAA_400040 [Candidatus Accumulibacter aalborgensis]|uniref:Uncharacterized protein n=1 Tax=Candidatus Accumulibacter aalborgensis TaxID=1860102 RepID=A0A1A8XRS0_9PROT|nr:hypothetical protein ACCAA_400040 [Candidatus Accumulibacter aalborgensis]